MSKLILPAAALLALIFVGSSADTAEAKGFHLRFGRVHVDVGNPHGVYGFNRFYNYNPYVVRRNVYHPRRPHLDWHDTSHYDWHPTEYRWHGNHWDVQPGHWDWHEEGHWDLHRGRRGHHGHHHD